MPGCASHLAAPISGPHTARQWAATAVLVPVGIATALVAVPLYGLYQLGRYATAGWRLRRQARKGAEALAAEEHAAQLKADDELARNSVETIDARQAVESEKLRPQEAEPSRVDQPLKPRHEPQTTVDLRPSWLIRESKHAAELAATAAIPAQEALKPHAEQLANLAEDPD